jgi:hypothetical protein
MNLVLKRWEFTDKSTVGSLSIDGVFECFTIEDVVRAPGVKVPGKTAIPYGTYRVTWERSPRLSKQAGRDVFTPRLQNVPGFEGILIHSGNTADDSLGCIILGRTYSAKFPDFVGESRAACAEFYAKVKIAAERGEPISITIEKGP